jgi:starvation-inducible DNA-binding protein
VKFIWQNYTKLNLIDIVYYNVNIIDLLNQSGRAKFEEKKEMKNKAEIANELNKLLANYQIYYQNLRGFHWNIQGRDFFELHIKFEELYNDAAIKIDEVAERILTIDSTPLHSFKDYLEIADLTSVTGINSGEPAVKEVVDNLAQIVDQQKQIRAQAEDSDDGATADMMATFIEEQEKTLWMYKAWLK